MLAGAPVELCEFPLGAGQADLEALDLAEPAFAFGFGDAGDEVVADLDEPVALGGVGPEYRAADASLSELAQHRLEPADSLLHHGK